ncbi:hypothetical protein PPL_04626 [Heterostelium album PN500]|uniref:EamA domain-containing protein n=1 Tax=Heterostelium pallidum (strain ATCC 26659 / Pp 5 / PN500) TaxID=670386 RepID=D3B835_HETP5|nr:hypothetical protein PPL_04626 [Heterostelium album PN500]EFA82203.1 hypothetical protein PPL_04626 [Heterostelium album PN500]|eukprot:XP_020434320.1 hypothetical protein PPL_04626 [Heterostelium album PN500]
MSTTTTTTTSTSSTVMSDSSNSLYMKINSSAGDDKGPLVINQKSPLKSSISTPTDFGKKNKGGAILLNGANMPIDSDDDDDDGLIASSSNSINSSKHNDKERLLLKTASGFDDKLSLNASSSSVSSVSTNAGNSTSTTVQSLPGGLQETTFKLGSSNALKKSSLLSSSRMLRNSNANVLTYSMDHMVLAASSDIGPPPPTHHASGAIMMTPIKTIQEDGTEVITMSPDGTELDNLEEIELEMAEEVEAMPQTLKEKLLFHIKAKLGLIFMVASSFFFSIMALLVNIISKKGIQSLEIAFIRSAFGLIGCLLVLGSLRVNPLGDKPKRLFLTIRGLSGTVSLAAYFFTITVLPLSEAVCISFTSPVITAALAAVVLKEKWGKFDAICAVLSLVGVGIISKPAFIFGSMAHDPNVPSEGHRLLYILIGIGGSFFSALSFVAVRKIGPGTNPFVLVAYFSAVASAVTLPASILFQKFVWPSGHEWLLLSTLGVIALIAQSLVNRGIQLEKAAKAASMNYTQIIFTFLWELIFLNEKPDWLTIIGALLILSCAGVTAFRK